MRVDVLKCQACGSNLDFVSGMRSASCPYCGQIMTLQDDRQESASFNAMIPVKLDRAAFRERVLEFLVSRELTPDDLIEKLLVAQNEIAAFVPFFRYRLSFDGGMTCDGGRQVQRDGNSTSIVWEPFQRNIKGRYSLDLCASQGIEPEVQGALEIQLASISLTAFQPEFMRDFTVEPIAEEVEPEELYMKRGHPRLQAHVSALATESAPTHNRNVKFCFDYKVEDKTPYLAALWTQSFDYEGQNFQLVMDACEGKIVGTAPNDAKKKLWLEEIGQLGVSSLGPAVAFGALTLLAGQNVVMAGLVTLGVFLGGYFGCNVLRSRAINNSTAYRRAVLLQTKLPDQQRDISALKEKFEAENKSIRDLRKTVKATFVWSTILVALACSIIAWYHSNQPDPGTKEALRKAFAVAQHEQSLERDKQAVLQAPHQTSEVPQREAKETKQAPVLEVAAPNKSVFLAVPSLLGRDGTLRGVASKAAPNLELMLEGSKTQDESKIAAGLEAVKTLALPQKGNRKLARAANDAGLAALKANSFTEAIEKFTEAMKADPSDQEVVNNLGYAFLKSEKFAEAKMAFQDALTLAPTRASAWANLAGALAKEDQADDALAAYLLAFKYSQNQKKSREFLLKLEQEDPDQKIRGLASKTLEKVGRE